MSLPSTDSPNAQTRQRLLEAAAEVFVERGFRNATIREICQRAHANIAAINYHFGDKERLYAVVLRYAFEKYPPDPGLGEQATAEQRLRAFVRSFLLRLLDEGLLSCYAKLMTREMVEPTRALDALVEESIRPSYELLMSIVSDLLGRDTRDDRVRLCATSIVSQCLYYNYARPVIARLHPEQRYDLEEIERLADHITQFSLSALERLSEGKKGDLR